ncbi:hypothetical protein DUI87_24986 [Hirundo rustica rustica]|uniref:GSKIP domain-containing protein n=10 Tax=Sylvioidea TaxID=2116661 RepID=A0A3M0JC74_HIRRU|nr:hypothetical protein DUI87_24986 [Hirundo rustica rustica]
MNRMLRIRNWQPPFPPGSSAQLPDLSGQRPKGLSLLPLAGCTGVRGGLLATLVPGGQLLKPRMETDYNPMELPNNTGFEEDSDYRDFEGTDVKDMRLEAEAVVNDVLFAVSNMFVSKTLPCAEDVAYINVETRERNRYCLELTEAGLRVVAYDFDQTDDRLQTPYHETVYSLLDSLSPAYREVFGNAILQRLEALKKESQS